MLTLDNVTESGRLIGILAYLRPYLSYVQYVAKLPNTIYGKYVIDVDPEMSKFFALIFLRFPFYIYRYYRWCGLKTAKLIL